MPESLVFQKLLASDTGTDQNHVKMHAKRDRLSDPLGIDDVLAIQDHIFPFNGADVFQQRGIHVLLGRVPMHQHPVTGPAWQTPQS